MSVPLLIRIFMFFYAQKEKTGLELTQLSFFLDFFGVATTISMLLFYEIDCLVE